MFRPRPYHMSSISYVHPAWMNRCIFPTFGRRRFSHDPSAGSWPHPFASSEPLSHLKSTFRAHASGIPRSAHPHPVVDAHMLDACADRFIAHLAVAFPRTRRATHVMYAWRASQAGRGGAACGSSNGGESGAGERLERLLELARCEDVVIVVFRWYGGVQLGSQRWKCISSVAKEALEQGGFMGSRGEPGGVVGEGGRQNAEKRARKRQ
ncbi:hypothetical protein B0H21DRAFT_468985 [Amylocystis lapponica]|nr:hypothetical protein B0H21DRAFT_468985 [Amylocystis lapponica]